MDYSEKELMKGIKIREHFVLYRFKPIRVLLWDIFIVHFVVNVVTIYFFLYHLDKKEVLNYSSAVLCVLYPMFGILVLLFESNLLENIQHGFPHWSLKSTNKKTRKEIEQHVKYCTTYAVFNFIISTTAGLTFMVDLKFDDKFFFAIKFFKVYFPNYSRILSFVYRLHLCFLSYIMIVYAYQVIYYTQHQKFQLYMFHAYIENISTLKRSGRKSEMFYNLDFQKEVRKRLLFCIERSGEFMRHRKQSARKNIFFVVMFSILSCLLGLGVIMYFFSGLVTSEYYLRMGLTSSGLVFVFTGLIWSGQSLEDNLQEIEALIKNVTWYNFDKDNKIVYLIFLINVTRDRKNNFSEKNVVNYKLGLSVLRGIYSILSVLLRLYYAKK